MALFETGQVVTTEGIAKAMLLDHGFLEAVRECLTMHRLGDWGDADDETRRQNDDALEAEREGRRTDSLFSVYYVEDVQIYIITEIDRSATTVLFPDEY